MNHCVSYVILASGIFDLFAYRWLGTFAGSLAACLVGGFWLLRVATQLYLGRRKGDCFVMLWFALLGLLHIAAGMQMGTSRATAGTFQLLLV